MVVSLRKEDIDSTDTAQEYESRKRELNLPSGYEKFHGPEKSDALNMPDISPSERMGVLDLVGRGMRNGHMPDTYAQGPQVCRST